MPSSFGQVQQNCNLPQGQVQQSPECQSLEWHGQCGVEWHGQCGVEWHGQYSIWALGSMAVNDQSRITVDMGHSTFVSTDHNR